MVQVVYKGRKKNTIEYFALKSVDKSQRERVLQEVRTLHLLRGHENVLQFYEWYETRNHLWLVLEYCVGGDLFTVIRQDGKLPEEYVRKLGLKIVQGLHWLHEHNIVSCDLKPSNVLLDENGRVKLCGFGLCRRVETSQSNEEIQREEHVGGKRGTPSYMAPELFEDQDMHSFSSDLWALGCMLYECVAGSPPFFSTSFTQMVDGILNKDPPPIQGASENFTDMLSKLLDKDPQTRLDWQGLLLHPFWAHQVPRSLQNSVAAPSTNEKEAGFDSTQTYLADKENRTSAPNRSGGKVDILRISHIVKENLRQELSGESYAPAVNEDVSVIDRDAELNFMVREAASPNEVQVEHSREERPDVSESPQVPKTHFRSEEKREQALEVLQTGTGRQGGVPGISSAGVSKDTPNHADTGQPSTSEVGQKPVPGELLSLLWHPNENIAKPLIMNQKIEEWMPASFNPQILGFRALPLSVLVNVSQVELEGFLSRIYRALSKDGNMGERVNVLAYLESLCLDPGAANVLANSSIMTIILTMLQEAASPELLFRLVSVIGLLLRHATYLGGDLPQSNLLNLLSECTKSRDMKLCRRSVAALGELLYYIATQQPAPEASHQSQCGQGQGYWKIPSDLSADFARLLRLGQDEICQHYAVKAIENVSMQGEMWGRLFSGTDVVLSLINLSQSSPNEFLKLSAVNSASRLLAFDRGLCGSILERYGSQLVTRSLMAKSPKKVQSWLNIACILSVNCPVRARCDMLEDCQLLHNLKKLLEHQSPLVRAKTLLVHASFFSAEPKQTIQALGNGLHRCVERLKDEEDKYVATVLDYWNMTLTELTPSLVGVILDATMRHSASGDSLENCVKALTSLRKFVPEQGFCEVILKENNILVLSKMLQRFDVERMYALHSVVLEALEVALSHPRVLYTGKEQVSEHLLPCLLSLAIKEQVSDVRFSSLKLTTDILVSLMAENNAQSRSASEPIQAIIPEPLAMLAIENLRTILRDVDPMPLYGLKLLYILLEENSALMAQVSALGLLTVLFGFLTVDHPHNNIYNVRMCRMACACQAVSDAELEALEAAPKACLVLQYAFQNQVEPFLEPVLGMLLALAKRGSFGSRKSFQASVLQCEQVLALLAQHDTPEVASYATNILVWVQKVHS